MYQTLLVIYLLVAVCMVALIMVQQGKGAHIGASFNAGFSGTLFGSSGSGNFITRMTATMVALFFILSLLLGNLSSKRNQHGGQWDNLNQTQQVDKEQVKALEEHGNYIPQ